MKKLFKLLFASALIASVAISCSDGPNGGDVPPGPDGPDVPTEATAEAQTAEGVSIYATEIANKDFYFDLQMGTDCGSYRFDIVPRARFENYYMEARKTKPDLSEEDYVIQSLFATDGSGGYTLNAPLESFWADSKFKQALVIPGIEYMILTCGCIDEGGNKAAEVNTLRFKLPEVPVVGDPQVDITLKVNPFGFTTAYVMNDDCFGYYLLETDSAVIDEAKRELGETYLRDVICCFQKQPIARNVESGVSWPYADREWLLNRGVTAILVPVDVNGTLAKTYQRKDDNLPPPPTADPADYKVEIQSTSALTLMTSWTVNYEKTLNVYYRWYTPAAFEAELKQFGGTRGLQIDFARGGAWAINKNSGDTSRELIWGGSGRFPLNQGATYELVSTATNKAIEFSEFDRQPFTMKHLVMDKPEESEAIVKPTVLSIDKTKVVMGYEIGGTTTLYFDCMVPKGAKDYYTGVDLSDPANREQLIDYLLTRAIMTEASYTEPFPFTALDPETVYMHYLIAEDSKGYLSALQEQEITTKSNRGGKNPKVALTGEIVKRADGSFDWKVKFTMNDDVMRMRYAVADDMTDSSWTTERRIDAWTSNVVGDTGLSTIGSTSLQTGVNEHANKVAIAVPFGLDDIQGPLAYLIFDPASLTSSMLPAKIYSRPL